MKGYFWLSLAVVLSLGSCLPPLDCPDPDPINTSVYFPNPEDCTSFYQCSNGVPILMPCPPGLHFNDALDVCDYPAQAKCERHCSPLGNEEHGQWSPATCASDLSDVGERCSLQCTDDYQLRGSAYVDCTDNGWSSTNGELIPKCVPVDCVGEIVEDILNKTLSVKAGLLFVLDESGSVLEEDFIRTKEFVKDIVTAYPLSENRSAGVITFSDTFMVRIHLSESSTSSFMTQMDAIKYRNGGTDILGALTTAIDEINGYHVHDLTLVFLITDGESSTDGTPAAEIIKGNNNPLFAIGVGSMNHVYLETLSSVGDDGIRLFFHTHDYSVLESIGNFINPPAGPGTSPSDPQCKSS